MIEGNSNNKICRSHLILFWSLEIEALLIKHLRIVCFFKESNCIDHIDPKFSDRQFWANSVEPDQAAAGAV